MVGCVWLCGEPEHGEMVNHLENSGCDAQSGRRGYADHLSGVMRGHHMGGLAAIPGAEP